MPDLLLFISGEMKKLYIRYGSFIKIQITDDFIKARGNLYNPKKRIDFPIRYHVVFITGKSYTNKTMIFCVALLLNITTNLVKKMLTIFF